MQATHKPAFPLSPTDLARNGTPQCAGSSDFCFLCEYSATGTPGDADVVGEMTGIAKGMAEQGKDVHVIALALHEAYERDARDIVQWRAPNGSEVASPEWTLQSITRHVLFSSELGAFGNAVNQILHSVIYNLNSTLVEKQSGVVDEERRKALMDTIKTTAVWQSSQTSSAARKRKRD